MRGRLLVMALLLSGCSGGVMDAHAQCEQTFGREELDGAARTTVGEVRKRRASMASPEMRGFRSEVWPGKADSERAVWCFLRRSDSAVTAGERPVGFPRTARSGR